jgi:hypothetical protein
MVMNLGHKAAKSLPAGIEFSKIDEMTDEMKNPKAMKKTPALVAEL